MTWNRSLLTHAALVLAAVCPGAQSFGSPAAEEWTRQAPLPTGQSLTGIKWATGTHGFATGQGLTLIETLDGGANWQKVPLGSSTDPLYNVNCIDTSVCMAIGNSSTVSRDIYRTANGGATWSKVPNFPLGGSWYHLDFVSPTVGFMGSNGATARSLDAGATWTLRSGFPSCPVMYGMDFRDATVGLCGGDRVSPTDGGPGIFKTTDAGATWVRKFSQSANDVLWLDNTTAIATIGIDIYRSTDSGETWSVISGAIFTGLTDMALLPGGAIVGVSSLGDAWRSDDGGFNWTFTMEGPGALPSDWNVSFYDDFHGTIVGQGGFILNSTDGGLTWTALNNGIGGVEYRALKMFDDNTGLAVGDAGYFARTTDGGGSWKMGRLKVTGIVLFRDENLNALDIVDQDFAVAAGNNGVVYKTLDRGLTWTSIGYPLLSTDLAIFGVKFTSREVGYITGSRPDVAMNVFKTIDGGNSWTQVNLNAGGLVDFVDPSHGWILNIGGLGYRTINGGATWTQFVMPNQGFSPTISSVDFINQNVGWAVGWFGYAARTSDGGVHWQLQNIATQNDVILGLHVLSETEAWAVGAPSGGSPSAYHTTNAGVTWTKTPLAAQYSLSAIFGTATGNVWAAGFDGVVLHRAGAGTTLQLLSAVSRKTHGAAGAFDVNLPLTGEPGVECRDGRGTHSFVFNFNADVVSGSATVVSGTGTAGAPIFAGSTMTVPFSGVTDVQKVTVKLTGVTDSAGHVLPETTVSANMLIGDVNSDKIVNRTDVTLTRGQVGVPVSGSNFREDVNGNGAIVSADAKAVQAANGHRVP
jgi:photosystem II stability/assembly factor-like uncharacterized protein